MQCIKGEDVIVQCIMRRDFTPYRGLQVRDGGDVLPLMKIASHTKSCRTELHQLDGAGMVEFGFDIGTAKVISQVVDG